MYFEIYSFIPQQPIHNLAALVVWVSQEFFPKSTVPFQYMYYYITCMHLFQISHKLEICEALCQEIKRNDEFKPP